MNAHVPQYTPSLEELTGADLHGKTVAISREILADLDTPVSAYLKIRGDGPSFLLESVEGGERIGRYSFIGAHPRRTLRVKNGWEWFDTGESRPCLDPLDSVKSMVDAYSPAITGPGRFEGGALGYLSYEAASYFEAVPKATTDPLDLPDAAFLDVDTLLIFDHVARSIRIVSHVWLNGALDEEYAAAAKRIDDLVDQLSAPLQANAPFQTGNAKFASNMDQRTFEEMVRGIKAAIVRGDLLQGVVSQRLSIPFDGDPFGLYRRLRVVSPSPFMYFIDFGDHYVVGASPELLIQVEGNLVSTRPIAGTRPRGATVEEDDALALDLVGDEKERAEHLMLVDLARNDVGRVSAPGTVKVPQFMEVERFSHVMHLVSDVHGTLRSGCDAYDALRAAFPAGTVSGAPKIRAMQIISDLESDQRGAYAGAVGFVNTKGDMEVAITIRTGVIKNGELHVQAGAGIVADSVPENEYTETLNKARALMLAAGESHDFTHR